jgi:hypothetical protein
MDCNHNMKLIAQRYGTKVTLQYDPKSGAWGLSLGNNQPAVTGTSADDVLWRVIQMDPQKVKDVARDMADRMPAGLEVTEDGLPHV